MFALVSPAAAPGAPDTPPRAGAPAPPPFPSTHSPGDRETTVGAVQLPRVDPRLAGAGTPDRAVLEWLHAWHRRQLARMTTWRDEHWATIMRSGDRDRLAARFRTNRLLGWLELPLRRAPTQATYLVEIEFRTLLDPVVRRRFLIVPMVREGPLGLASPVGRWVVEAAKVHDASPLA